MKLGSQTGSVINHLMARGTLGQPEAKVGMGATILMWTDRRAATIFRVFQHKGDLAVEVRDDNEKVVSGSCHDGSAAYEFTINVRGCRGYFVFKADRWREASMGEDGKLRLAVKGGGHGLRIGAREAYYCDPSF